MKKFVLISLAFIVSSHIMAQDNNFMIYSFKGNVTVIDNKVETGAKIGKVMKPTTTIRVAAGGIVSLICDQSSMFTFSKPGSYLLSKYTDSCSSSTSSVSANYVKYVWNQLTSHEASPGSNRKAFMNTVGAVTRSVNNIWIDPKLDTVNYTGGDFPLSWKSYAEAKEFQFFLYTSQNVTEPIYTATVSKMKVAIPSFISKMKAGNSYFWTSAIKGEENDEMKVLNYVSKATYDALVGTFKSQGPASEGAAEQAYRVAFMLEDAHYLSEAYEYYTKAAAADSNNALYRFTLMSFKKDYEIK